MDSIWNELLVAVAAFGVLMVTVVGGALVTFLRSYLDAKRKEIEQRYAKDIAETAVLSAEEYARSEGMGKSGSFKHELATKQIETRLQDAGVKQEYNTDALINEQVRKMKSWGLEEPVEEEGLNVVSGFASGTTVYDTDGEAAGYLQHRNLEKIRGFAGLTTPRDMQPFGQDEYPMPAGGYGPGGNV